MIKRNLIVHLIQLTISCILTNPDYTTTLLVMSLVNQLEENTIKDVEIYKKMIKILCLK